MAVIIGTNFQCLQKQPSCVLHQSSCLVDTFVIQTDDYTRLIFQYHKLHHHFRDNDQGNQSFEKLKQC